MTYNIIGTSKVVCEAHPETGNSSLREIQIRLDASPETVKKQYMDEKGLPRKEGIMPLSIAFIHGLSANVKNAHAQGLWDAQEHIAYIMDELKRALSFDNFTISEGILEEI